jgi:hypothetical protein
LGVVTGAVASNGICCTSTVRLGALAVESGAGGFAAFVPAGGGVGVGVTTVVLGSVVARPGSGV